MNYIRFVLIVCIFLIPEIAAAHSPIKGIGNFYNGILHPVLVPSHLMAILGFGLLIGQQGSKVFEKSVLVFLGAIVSGLCITGFAKGYESGNWLLVIVMLCGVGVALARSLPFYLYLAVGLVCGLLIGLDSAPDTLSGKAKGLSLLGTFIGAGLSSFYVALMTDKLKKKWQQIGVRILGSWICASGLLVLTLSLSGNKLNESKDNEIQKSQAAASDTPSSKK